MPGYPLPRDETHRLAVLPDYDLLGSPPDAEYDQITDLAAALFGVPIALISIIGEHEQWLKSHHGLTVDSTARNVSFCAHTIAGGALLVVPDALADPRFRDNPLTLGEPKIRFYAGAPLVNAEGVTIGALCIIDTKPRDALSFADGAVLERMAAHVARKLDARRASVLEARIKARRADRSCTGAGSARARGWVAGLRGALDALEQRVGAERMTTPAFDVMLVLFVAREQGRGLSVAECCREAGLSSSTGLRHVTTLTEHGLIVQGDDPLDRRRRTLHLSPATSAAMEAWVRTLIDLSGCAPEARAA